FGNELLQGGDNNADVANQILNAAVLSVDVGEHLAYGRAPSLGIIGGKCPAGESGTPQLPGYNVHLGMNPLGFGFGFTQDVISSQARIEFQLQLLREVLP